MPYFWDTVPETLPQPELNPLTNPVLERNLGRWAQAYFSNPPGQRELAISKLLEEIKSETSDILTAERARREFSARPSELRSPDPRSSESRSSRIESPDVRPGNIRRDEVSSNEARHSAAQPDEVSLKDERTVTCLVCRHQNAERERFCGQCGAALSSVESASENRNRKENRDNRRDELSDAPQVRAEIPRPQADVEVPGSAAPDNEVQWLRERAFSNAYEYEDPPSNGWKYVLGIVVIAAAGFAYLHWSPNLLSFLNQNKAASPVQGTSARVMAPTLPRTAEEQPSHASPSTPKGSAPEPAAVTASTPDASQDQNQDRPSPATPAPQPAQDRSITPSGVRPAAVQSASLGAASHAATSTTPPLETLDGGIADLRQAQHFLVSSTGARDTSEAAKFLWKAVRQQNATAAVLLSELYASGDGVSKNCDQARLLLVAAAKRGSPLAADQLRILEQRGCR